MASMGELKQVYIHIYTYKHKLKKGGFMDISCTFQNFMQMDWETRMTLYYYLKQIVHIRPTCRVLYVGGDSTILLADYVTDVEGKMEMVNLIGCGSNDSNGEGEEAGKTTA